MRLVRVLAAALAASTIAGSAFAADLPSRNAPPPVYVPPAPVFTWTGLYVGVNGGAWINNSKLAFAYGSGKLGGAGGLVGGTVEYNWQTGSGLVLGVETDLDYRTKANVTPLLAAATNVSDGYLGTLRARLGYGAGRGLFYLTGGMAYGDTPTPGVLSSTLFGFYGVPSGSKPTSIGWTAGAGVEFAVTNNWSVKGEYLYADLGKHGLSYQGLFPFTVSEATADHIVRAGLNYRFNFGGAPAYSKY